MADERKNDITYFAEANFRNEKKKFGIKRNDRTKHTYIIGKTGMGKTTLLENMAAQDIFNGEGIGIVDPHGDFAEKMLKFVPPERIGDVLYFSPADIDYPIAFNVMENVDPTQRYMVANGLLGVFKKIWPDVWSPRMEYILNNCILALLEYPNSTLLGINRMLSDKTFRNEVISNVKDPVVKSFWTEEFAKYSDKFMTEAGAAIQNKVGQFISNPLIRNIIGQPHSSFDIREVMDDKKIFLMNLSKGRIGEENSRLIGAMLITKVYLAAMSRVNIPDAQRKDFYLYVDEFQNFATDSFKDILSEARKYRLNLVLAHQYIAQMDESVRDAVVGNVGTIISFRVGAFDAELLEKEFAPDFIVQDIVNLGFASIYLKLMIDGVASRPFSATTLPPIQPKGESNAEEIIAKSREKYATERKVVEDEILAWHKQEGLMGPKASAVAGQSGGGFVMQGKPVPRAGAFREQEEGPKPEMFEASCAECGKTTYVPFKPDGVRPIYCKTHRKQPQEQAVAQTGYLSRAEEQARPQSSPSQPAPVVPTIPTPVPAPPTPAPRPPARPPSQSQAQPRPQISTPFVSQPVRPADHPRPAYQNRPAQSATGGRNEVGRPPAQIRRTFQPPQFPQKTISLRDLESRISPQPRQEQKEDALKKLLDEIREEKADVVDHKQNKKEEGDKPLSEPKTNGAKSGVLKPGETVKF